MGCLVLLLVAKCFDCYCIDNSIKASVGLLVMRCQIDFGFDKN